jgi:hypothetical protein
MVIDFEKNIGIGKILTSKRKISIETEVKGLLSKKLLSSSFQNNQYRIYQNLSIQT